MKKTKLSVIFDLPKELRSEIERVQKSVLSEFDNVVKTEDDLHVTLAYADDIEESRIEEIRPKLKEMLADVSFDIRLSQLGHLVNKDNQGIIYVDIQSDILKTFYKKVRSFLEGYGGKFTYPEFKGHMTLVYLDKPLSAAQMPFLATVKLNELMKIRPEHVRISVREGDDWIRIGRIQISKRDVLICN